MIKRTKKAKITERKIECYNCGYLIDLSPQNLNTKTIEKQGVTIIATYMKCPVCEERMLMQLDTAQTYYYDSPLAVKLTLKQKTRKLSRKEKDKLSKLNRSIDNTRRKLKPLFWNEIYQLLNPQETEQTGTADQELTLGDTQEPTPETVGKEIEHEQI